MKPGKTGSYFVKIQFDCFAVYSRKTHQEAVGCINTMDEAKKICDELNLEETADEYHAPEDDDRSDILYEAWLDFEKSKKH